MITKNLVAKLNEINGADESLGKTLRSIRLCDEMSLKEFSTILNISISYLSDLEHGRRIASAKKAYEYAKKLEYPAEEFIRLALQDEANNLTSTKGLKLNRLSITVGGFL
ncbi:MAG: helix-turn-helix domain-containing protein [Proteobacteria bacterium]|jgi:transcriptional regulator with XRE-family HTH domain|nr:helix-turn-helix domain-containing protein [Pseudomonadota bacterium]